LHPVEQAKESILNLQKAGFQNISIDLIYGFPGLSQKIWKTNLQKFIDLKLPHLSAYHLTYEEKTVLGHRLKTKQFSELSEDESLSHYNLLCKILAKKGYSHYEVSNFALPGFESKHNKSYWESKPYLGLGPAAHSFNSKIRQWNHPNLYYYIKHLNSESLPPHDAEILSPTDQYNDYIITRMRTSSGIDLDFIKTYFPDKLNYLTTKINSLKKDKRLFFYNERLFKLTEYGFLISNKVMEAFIIGD